MLVADVGDALAVGRPARVPAVELAEGQRQRRRAVGRRHPQLLPLPAVVAGEQHQLAVGRGLGPRAPAGLLAQHLAAVASDCRPRPTRCRRCPTRLRDWRRRGCACRRASRTGSAHDRRANNNSARSCFAARRAAGGRCCNPSGPMSATNRLKWPVPLRRHPGDALAVGRQPRLDIDRACRRSAPARAPVARSSRHSSIALPS